MRTLGIVFEVLGALPLALGVSILIVVLRSKAVMSLPTEPDRVPHDRRRNALAAALVFMATGLIIAAIGLGLLWHAPLARP
jgi:hypothetical protein